MSSTKTKKKIDVEALLAKKSNITSSAVQSALKRLEEEKLKEQEEMLLEHLATIQEA